jgi:hypothetical protein
LALVSAPQVFLESGVGAGDQPAVQEWTKGRRAWIYAW